MYANIERGIQMRRGYLNVIADQYGPDVEADREGFSRDIERLTEAKAKIEQRLGEISKGGETNS